MTNKLYFSGRLLNTFPSFPIEIEILDAATLQEASAISDYVMSRYTDGYLLSDKNHENLIKSHKSAQDWISSSWLYADVDNVTEPYLSIADCEERLEKIKYYLTTSKSHQKAKGNNPPADRYHLLFPLDREITDPIEHKRLLKALHEQVFGLDIIDPACIDSARMFYGNPNNITMHYDGESIESRIVLYPEIEKEVIPPKPLTYTSDKKMLMMALRMTAKKNIFTNHEAVISLGWAMRSAGYTEEDYLSLVPPERLPVAERIYKTPIREASYGVGRLIRFVHDAGYTDFKIRRE